MQATRIRPATGPTDRRRLAAAGLSAVLPGLGQLFNGRPRLAALFLLPSLILLLLAVLLLQSQSPASLAAWVVGPQVLGTLLSLNMIILAWRLTSVGQAFLDTRRTGPTGRLGAIGIVILVLLVVLPHLAVYRYGSMLGTTFASIFSGEVLGASGEEGVAAKLPNDGQRINVLIVGIDKTGRRTSTLTDTMMVASLDPVGHTVSIVSIPRDLIDTPLPDGNVYGPKLNSLYQYGNSHKDEFPGGGMRALEDAAGALLGVPIHYYAEIDFSGFIDMVDAVGGVDVVVPRGFEDPTYDGVGFEQRGWSITAGPHHLDGANALAYARSRKALGESDFTRAARQQQILVALRNGVTRGGSLLFQLPALLDAVGKTVHTNVPTEQLPALAAVIDGVGRKAVTSVVIKFPLVHPKSTRFGDSQEPDVPAIRAMAGALFSTPGTAPADWPTPKPTKAPKTPKPAATPKPAKPAASTAP